MTRIGPCHVLVFVNVNMGLWGHNGFFCLSNYFYGMNEVLTQKRVGLASKEFKLTDTGILVRETRQAQQWEYKVAYDDIGFDTMIKRDMSTKYVHLILSVLFGGSLVVLIACLLRPGVIAPVNYISLGIWIILSGFLCIKAWLQRNTSYEYLTGGSKTLELFMNLPDEEAYNTFLSALYGRIKATHRKRLLDDADMNLPLEMHEPGIAWLKKIEAVSDEDILAFKRRHIMHQKRHWN